MDVELAFCAIALVEVVVCIDFAEVEVDLWTILLEEVVCIAFAEVEVVSCITLLEESVPTDFAEVTVLEAEAALLFVVALVVIALVLLDLSMVVAAFAEASRDNFNDALVSSARSISAFARFPNADTPKFNAGIRCTATVPVAFTSGLADRVRAGVPDE